MSPANHLAANPAALRRVAQTGGRSVLHGAQNMARDLARGGLRN
jgi:poly(3-hydroxyalkanoate) synthetase